MRADRVTAFVERRALTMESVRRMPHGEPGHVPPADTRHYTHNGLDRPSRSRRATLAGGQRRRITVRLIAGIALAAVGLMALPATPAVADPVPPACTPSVQTTDLALDPDTVIVGDSTTATLVVRNCSPDPEPVTATWTGRFLGPHSGIPHGCPVIDPLDQQATLAPYSESHLTLKYTVPSACRALGLVIIVQVQQDATNLGVGAANLRIIQL